MKIDEIVEQLECALINCDNIKKVGTALIDLVKLQIQEALKLLREDNDEPA
jgi:hypothetical protein